MADGLQAIEAELRAHALGLPEAQEEFPWGESAFKVRRKTFVFLHRDGEALSLTVKLPHSKGEALFLPFTRPSGYGLGRAGWVTARFAPDDIAPLDILCRWIDESYRAVAPKRLTASLDRPAGAP